MLSALIAANPDAAREWDDAGSLPLHLAAAAYRPCEAAVRALIGANPDALSAKDGSGWLPLHWATYGKAPTGVLEALISANPEAAKEKDENGWLPLHWSAYNGASEGAVTLLVAANPEGARHRTANGKLPSDYCPNSSGRVKALLEENAQRGGGDEVIVVAKGRPVPRSGARTYWE